MDVQILGAGAWGLSAALALARRGFAVRVHDPRGIGSGATAKAAGILSTMVWDDRDAKLVQETATMLDEFPQAERVWRRCPSMVIAPRGSPALGALKERAKRFGVKATAGANGEINLQDDEEVLWVTGDGVVEAGDLCEALSALCRDAGVTFGSGDASNTMLAAGAWTPSLLQLRGAWLPLKPYRTQLASLRLTGGEEMPIVHDLVHGFYTRPGGHGEFLAGNGTQLRTFDPENYNEAGDPDFIERQAERIVTRFQRGHEARIAAAWAGLCVATPDRRPLIGQIPELPNTWVMSGDNGFGVMRCLALGERFADAFEGRPHPDLSPTRFAPNVDPDFVMREGFEP